MLAPINILYMVITSLFIKGNKNEIQELPESVDRCLCVHTCLYIYLYIYISIYIDIYIYLQNFVCPNMHSVFSIQIADLYSFPSKKSEFADLLVARDQIPTTSGRLKYSSSPQTVTFRMDKQWGPTAQHKELYPVSWDRPHEER